MLFLQTKFVKCKKILYKNYFVNFANFFFINNFKCTFKKKFLTDSLLKKIGLTQLVW